MDRDGDVAGCTVAIVIIVFVGICIAYPQILALIAIVLVPGLLKELCESFFRKKERSVVDSSPQGTASAVITSPVAGQEHLQDKKEPFHGKEDVSKEDVPLERVVESRQAPDMRFEIRGMLRTYGVDVSRQVRGGEMLTLSRDPGNAYDRNAILVLTATGDKLGYVAKEVARTLAPRMDAGSRYGARVIPGTYSEWSYGKCLVELIPDEKGAEETSSESKVEFVSCPECQSELEVPTSVGEQSLTCGKCGIRFVWRNATIYRLLECVFCGKDVEVGEFDEADVIECPHCHYACAGRRDPFRLEPYPWFDRSSEADEIRAFARERGITRIVHFTSFMGLKGILATGQILSRRAMNDYRKRNPGDEACRYFRANDQGRWDARLGCINTSVEKINSRLLWVMQRRSESANLEPWCILELNVACLEKQGTCYSVANAASTYVRLHGTNPGLSGLRALFAERIVSGVQSEDHVAQTYVVSRSRCRATNRPTDDQAEVLIPDALPVGVISAIVFKSLRDRDYVRNELGPRYPVLQHIKMRVDADAFEDRSPHQWRRGGMVPRM